MPYIKNNDGRREALRRGESALNAGELNYQIFYYVKHNYDFRVESIRSVNMRIKLKKQIRIYVDNFLGEKPNYQRYNDMTGALIRCENELERRLNRSMNRLLRNIMGSYDYEIANYEDEKIKINGDVE